MAYKMLLDSVPVHFSKLIEHPQWLSLSSLHMPRLFPAFVYSSFLPEMPYLSYKLFFVLFSTQLFREAFCGPQI